MNIDSDDSKVMISILTTKIAQDNQKKLENADLQALLNENLAQSISELARQLNVDHTTVTKHLHDIGNHNERK